MADRASPPLAHATRLWPRLRWPEPPHLLLIAVALAYFLLVVFHTPQAMVLTYDEVVYASQVSAQTPATQFYAHRARGMTLLVAPVVTITEWVVALRIYLAVLAGVFMYLAFRPWLAPLARAGGGYAYVPAVAAGAFATLWMTVLYGSMADPNLWLAFALVAGVGYFCRAMTAPGGPARPLPAPSPGWGLVAAVAIAFAAASLIRPTDALAAAGPLLVAPVVVRGWRRARPWLAVMAGLAVGWCAWIAEAIARFDGPVERWRLSARATGSGLSNAIPHNLQALDGPWLLCRPAERCEGIEPHIAAWWIALPVLVAAGLLIAARARWPAVGALATASAVAVAVPYLFLIDYAAPRFLLPAYGLLAIPVAAGLVWLLARKRTAIRALVFAVVAVALVLHMRVQLAVLDGVNERLLLGSWRNTQQAEFLRDEQGVGPPCLYWGVGAIQQSYLLKCRSVLERGRAPGADDGQIAAALQRGDDVVVVTNRSAVPPEFMAGWRRVDLPGGRAIAYLPPS